MIATAQAQTDPARGDFSPIPNTLPDLLIAPVPLSGTLLRPLSPGASGAPLPEVAPQAGDVPVAVETDTAPPPPVAAIPEATAPAAGIVPAPPPAVPAVPGREAVVPPPVVPAPAPAPPPAPARPAQASITVIVEGVESNEGVVNVAMCDKSLSEEGCPHSQQVKAAPGFVEARFDGIAPGTYAVVGYHDVNGNDEFDKFLGVPREPYALSSKAGDKMVPTFADAALKINKGDNTVIIRLQRLLGGS